MITLKEVYIHKYKCFNEKQCFSIDPKITVLVGMNESGKTALLETIAKSNYFINDEKFIYNSTLDYPRKEKKRYDKSGEIATVFEGKYELSDELMELIADDIGDNVFLEKEFTYLKKFDNSDSFSGIQIDINEFFKNKIKEYGPIEKEIEDKLLIINTNDNNSIEELLELTEDEKTIEFLTHLKKYFHNEINLPNSLDDYVITNLINPNLPKYLYYSEYYTLPSRIDLSNLQSEEFDEDSSKTSKALFDLADINLNELMSSDNFESYIAELEATSSEITQILFKYWSNNKNLRIRFEIDKKLKDNILVPILDIRVENLNHMISLPLKNRSKGFNWFFSFIVWFSKIQENKDSNYIILLDEPGLNLHAKAQADFLSFIEDLSQEYQIIYTTHSPFMVESDHLERVRTLVETDEGTKISDSIQENDPNTLFPLQAALGYDIAQNLFISKNNLLVEGPADLLYLTIISSILEAEKMEGLKDGITIVPVGGLDKVSTFISLLRGNRLNIVCLLDSFENAKGKQKVDDLIRAKIIKANRIHFFNEFVSQSNIKADIEDLFEKEEYLRIFNEAFGDYPDINIKDLNPDIERIVLQINKFLKVDRFNHYRPANKLAQMAVNKDFFSENTLLKFEKMFNVINKLF